MASVKIDELMLDSKNPRHTPAKSQKETMTKVLEEQKDKLVKLAESVIAQKGLSPLDNILVLDKKPGESGYVVLEGNRRVAVLKILNNPSLMDGAKISKGIRDRLDDLSTKFKRSMVEPIDVSVIKSRKDAKYWINLRHTGENKGAGVVQWATSQQERFQGPSAQLEIIDFVRKFGGLSDYELGKLEGRFITTLKRLVDAPDVRSRIGIEKSGKSIFSNYPAPEIMKPLKKIVLDLALKQKSVTELKSVKQMTDYVDAFLPSEKPNPSKKISAKSLSAFTAADFIATPKPTPPKPAPPKPGPLSPKRTGIVPPGQAYYVTSPRISKIQQELVTLKYTQHINAIAVLFRVFVETSADHYLGQIGSSTKKANGNFKSLAEKITEVCNDLITAGADKKIFNPLKSALHSPSSPLWIDLMHSYVHSSAGSPTAPMLEAAWDHASPLMKEIWK